MSTPQGGSGPEALCLISPGGTRYQPARWADARFAPQLLAWSPDGQRALFQVFSGKGGVEVLTLAHPGRAVADQGARQRGRGLSRHPVLQPGER
jgi:hypothetical protein